ncbi:MAG: IS110 family transposase [Taibaiella sp.]|nr:IS110 family transposase [Taibaiella sp.]
MKQYQFFVGIDVSKETLDYAVVRNGEQLQYLQTPNSTSRVKMFLKGLKKLGTSSQDVIFCLEHTGIYCNHLLSYLTTLGLDIWMESPTQIKRSLGIQRGKNDKVDAQRIALYAFRYRDAVKLWQPPRKELLKLKHLMSLRNRILKTIGILSKVFSENSFYEKEFVQMTTVTTKASLQALRHDLASIDGAIDEIVKIDEKIKHLFSLITSVRGIGRVTAIQIIISTNEFKNIADPKKFACYCGVAPFEHTSGTSVRGKNRVSKMADMNLKKCLHMAALSVVHYRGELHDFFDRKVAEGKNKMSIINAIRNKLIHRVFACVRDNRPYSNEYVYNAV